MKKTISALAFASSSAIATAPASSPAALKDGYLFRNVNTGDSIATKRYPNLSPGKLYAVFKNAADYYIVIACEDIRPSNDINLEEARMNCPEIIAAP